MNNIKRVQKDIYFDNFLSQHMNRVPLAVFIIEDDHNNAINTGTAGKLRQLLYYTGQLKGKFFSLELVIFFICLRTLLAVISKLI